MNFDHLDYPYTSRRTTSIASNGMVATSQPLAAQAGLEILKAGGNAIDAAVATAACLTVVEPTSNGIGSDAFALIWTNNKLKGLNASGFSPADISIPTVKKRGYEKMPANGWLPVTVPGAPSAWAELIKTHGNLSLKQVLKPAINYAREGYPISPTTGQNWQKAFKSYQKKLKGEQFKSWFQTFAPNNRPPEIGEIWSSPEQARTLE
ncbi:MAG: gamma-glutamyltransferase, partial [Halanaerobiales bacterium]